MFMFTMWSPRLGRLRVSQLEDHVPLVQLLCDAFLVQYWSVRWLLRSLLLDAGTRSGGATGFFLHDRCPALHDVLFVIFSAALCAVHGTCIVTFLCTCVRASLANGSPITVQSQHNHQQSLAWYHSLCDACSCAGFCFLD